MIIDIRYHIVSLVAVFLALGLGILIGTSMAGNDALVKQQSAMIDRLTETLESFKAERKELEAQAAQQEARIKADELFARKTMPLLVRDRLFGKQIALVRTTESLGQKATDEFISALKLAGADVTSVTTLTADLASLVSASGDDASPRTDKADPLGNPSRLGTPAVNSTRGAKDAGSLAPEDYLTALATSIAQGIHDPITDYLRSHDLVRVRGAYGVPADVVIVIGGGVEANATSWSALDVPFIRKVRALGTPVAAVEPLTVQTSYINHYKAEAALTVDNIDTAAGQIALILALSEGKTGHFGMKETGKPALPDLPGGTP